MSSCLGDHVLPLLLMLGKPCSSSGWKADGVGLRAQIPKPFTFGQIARIRPTAVRGATYSLCSVGSNAGMEIPALSNPLCPVTAEGPLFLNLPQTQNN